MEEIEEISIPPSYRVFHQGRLVRGGGPNDSKCETIRSGATPDSTIS